MLLLLSLIFPCLAQAPTDLQVKATYLYKFGSFVTWPNPPNDSFNICILGHDPFGATLDSLVRGESLNGAKFAVLRITGAQEATRCRIVYVSPSEEDRARGLISELAKTPVLTVSDMPHFLDRGGMVQFLIEDGRVRFEVNLTSAERAGLTLSSQLLKVASAVKREGGH